MVVTLLAVGVVAGAAIAQAIREHSLGPIWSVAWLPAVLVVAFRRPDNPRQCWRRLGGRPRA
jgi:hypothetical protein